MIERTCLLDFIEEGDGVMADKGFIIKDMLEKRDALLIFHLFVLLLISLQLKKF